MTNAFTWNTKGFVTVSLLLFVPLIILTLAASVSLALRSQERLALQFRLDTCAIEVMDQRIQQITQLEQSNSLMQPLRLVVYAARGTKVVSAGASTIGEAAALIALRTIARGQEALILKARAQELWQRNCRTNKFSAQLAVCQFAVTPAPSRKPALFPDVPGDINLERVKIFSVSCADWVGKNMRTNLILKGHEYAYTK
jgi:hypothetical protein